jgi:hypothetical protein
MTIYEFADIINRDIEVKRFANQKDRWIAKFSSCDIKGDSVLIGAYGDAKSPIGAIQDYVRQIRNKTLVFDAMGKRQEYNVPEKILSPNI